MNYTNAHNIDPAIVQAVLNDPYESGGDISVTGLCKPPQMVALEQLHRDEVTEDVADRLWALLGQTVHVVLDRAAPDNTLSEERLETEVMDWTVTGRPDLWREPAEVVDYKVTSVWSFLLGEKPDWTMQLNLYAALYRRHGFPVTKLTIAAILRDWTKSRIHDQGYPQIPFMSVNVPLWAPDVAEQVLLERVLLHQAARDGRYVPCTDTERWAKPDRYAVMKQGRKSALRVLDTEADASSWMQRNGGEYIDLRPGENTRCESYCSVMPWCEQAKQLGVGKSTLEWQLAASIEGASNGD